MMEKICEVSNPEMVLKQLEKYYGDEVDLYLSTSKNKKYMVFDEDSKKSILEVCFIRIIPSIKIKNEERVLGIEIEDGQMPISIPPHIYHIICYGD